MKIKSGKKSLYKIIEGIEFEVPSRWWGESRNCIHSKGSHGRAKKRRVYHSE